MKRLLGSLLGVILAAAVAFAEGGGVRPNDGAYTSSTGATVNVQNNGASTDQNDPPGSETASTGVHYDGQMSGHYYREVDGNGNFVCWRQYFDRTGGGYRWNRYDLPTGSTPPSPTATPNSTGTM